MVKNVRVGKMYSCRVPGIENSFDVVVLRKINNNEFLVKAIYYDEEQNKILREYKYVLTVGRSYLSKLVIEEDFKVEIGKIYVCQLPDLEGTVDVEVLKNNGNRGYLVRLIRCTKSQREQLDDNYLSRFIIPRNKILGISKFFYVKNKERGTTMPELTKSEYHVLVRFYEANKPVTKHELVTLFPELVKNTTATVITSLLNKGYLEVDEVRLSGTVLARAFKPSVSFLSIIKEQYGFRSDNQVVEKILDAIGDTEQLDRLLVYIEEKKVQFLT